MTHESGVPSGGAGTGGPGWIRATLLAGLAYLLIGRLFPQPAEHREAWRLAAWLVSGVVYGAHIWYEHSRLRNAPLTTAVHVAAGVALGGFALAVAAIIHSFSTPAGFRTSWVLALVLWPALTGIPAFVGALVAATLLRRLHRGTAPM